MKMKSCLLAIIVIEMCITGCTSIPDNRPRLRLPEGDPERGLATFVELQCNACHDIAGRKLPPVLGTSPASVQLGGWYVRAKTYEELITSIIHPSHELTTGYYKGEIDVDGESLMPIFNDVMTVTQLIDLVAFLQEEYEIFPPPRYAEYDF